jgi:two-component system OmpR family response regulator
VRVLLVEDSRPIGEAIQAHVSGDGHAVDWAQNLATARDFLAVAAYDLVLLDLGLPDGRGIDLLKGLRRNGSSVSVVILSAQDQIAARIEALNEGADDYLTKPFDLSELTARINAVARRYAGQPQTEQLFGPLRIDATNHRVFCRDVSVDLSAREWAVLLRLTQRRGAVVAKSEIEDALYAFGAEVESNTVEVYVSRLRKKLGRETIRTLRGLGYQVVQEDPR